MPSTLNAAIGSVATERSGPSSWTPGMAASPLRSNPASSSSCAGRIPSDRGELVDRRVQRDRAHHVRRARLLALGRSVQATSSRSTRSTAPPPARNGSPSANARRGRAARRRRRARTSCGRSRRCSRPPAGSGRWGASCAPSTSTGTSRACAASMIASSGGIQPVTLEAPVTASSRGRGPGVERGDDVVDRERAVGAALDEASLAQAGPRQQVGVVLDHGRHDHVVRSEAQPVGEVVDRLGRVAAEDRHVVAVGRRGRRSARPRPRALVGGRGHRDL